MEQALIGLVGILLGLIISEYFRRNSRVETFAKEIFQKRLKIYETLYYKINNARSIASDIFANPEYSKDERHAIWSEVVMDIAEYNDKHALFLHDEIIVHCLSSLMGIDEYYYIDKSEEKEKYIQQFRDNCVNLIGMIKNEVGLTKIQKLFGKITGAKHESEIIKYYKELKQKYKKKGIKALSDAEE